MQKPRFMRAWPVVSAAVLSAVAAALLSIHAYWTRAAWTLEMDGPLPALAQGFYPTETAPDGLTFAWTGSAADISLEGLDRRVEWKMSLVVMVWRQAGAPRPAVHVMVDGVERLARTVARDGDEIDLTLPERPARRGAVVTIRVVPPFTPGSGADARELGLAIDRISLTPTGGFVLPPPRTLFHLTVAMSLLGAAIAASGVPALAATAIVLPLAAGQAWLASHGLAPYLDYAGHALWLALSVGVGLVLAVRVLERVSGRRLDAPGRFVAIASAAALSLRMLVLLHPEMPVGDALFHAHRLEYVLEGRAFFTSLAPGNYSFPYPILLYLVAAPFSFLTSTSDGHIVLLRAVVTVADVLAGVAIYVMVVRAWNDRLAGAAALAIYHLFPLAALTMTWGNLTNAFGQTLFVGTTALLASSRLRMDARRRVLTLAAVMSAAFLAHPSTFGILAGLAAFAWLFFRVRGRADERLRSAANAVLVATTAAGLVAVALYYAHFLATYGLTFGRIGSELATTAAVSRWTYLSERLATVPAQAVEYFAWPAVLLAALGLVRLRAVARGDRLRLVLAAWGAASLVFLILGLLTPINLRYYLALLPVVAMLAGLAWSDTWRGHPRRRIALVVLAGWMIWAGVARHVAPLG